MVRTRDPSVSKDTSTQSERFKEMARQLGADEDEGRFRDKLRVIARQKPKDSNSSPAPGTEAGHKVRRGRKP